MALQITSLLMAALSWMICRVETSQMTNSNSIALEIENLQSATGEVHVAIYDREEHFKKSLDPYRLKVLKVPSDGQLHLELEDIPYGRYALAVYHDENGNGDLDKNMLGIPKEPYGFSNNPRAKWSAPTYKETSFVLGPEPTHLAISLKKWKDR